MGAIVVFFGVVSSKIGGDGSTDIYVISGKLTGSKSYTKEKK
jgi:hypothetical protein